MTAVSCQCDGAVAEIVLARPRKRNALRECDVVVLRSVIRSCASGPDPARAVLIRAEGPAFCAGRDLTGAEPGTEDGGAILRDIFNPLIADVAGLDVPTIAAVQGAAMGAGLGLALACGARNLTAMGVRPGDIAWQSYGYGLWIGGGSLDRAFEAVGVTTFPASPGRTTLAVERLADHGVTVISCTPTFALLLTERAADLGRDQASEWRLRVGVLGGETMTQAARHRLAELMPPGFRPHNTYGTTELGGPFLAGTCEYGLDQGTFHVWADHYRVEIVDPDSGQPVTEPGVLGELLVTTLRREASPMLRWRTRDLTAWAPDSRDCPCGRRAHLKISWILGCSDDMIKVRGALVLPWQVEELICTTNGTGAGWQLVVERRTRPGSARLRPPCKSRWTRHRRRSRSPPRWRPASPTGWACASRWLPRTPASCPGTRARRAGC